MSLHRAFTYAFQSVISASSNHAATLPRSLRLSSTSTTAFPAFPTGSQSTIYALATGGIRCALVVIRVSGPCSSTVVSKIGRFPSSTAKMPEPRKATLRKLYDPLSNNIIDHGIVLWFPGPKSFTGEDSCEFHVHGGPAVITSLFQALGRFPGCRMAEPGEFSKRAFLNGKMDLTAVEGLGDLISAETEMQRAQALSQMSGNLGSLYESWRDRIARCLANAEAFIDFGEDENIESDILETVEIEITRLLKEMTNHLKDQRRGERLRNGVRVAILGRPNVGKSSLLNILSKRDAAIVSSIPGTTRDVVETCIDLKGYPVIFADTAGIRASPDEIEKEGIRRAVQEALKADVVLLIASYVEISQKFGTQYFHGNHFADRSTSAGTTVVANPDKMKLVQEELPELLAEKSYRDKPEEFLGKVVLVANKVDLALDTETPSPRKAVVDEKIRENMFDACISCKTLSGLETFTDLLAEKVAKMCMDPKLDAPCLTRERYRHHLQNCVENLTQYMDPDSNQQDLALRIHSLKIAMNNIGFITGHLGNEDILDIIFKEFCIGK